MRAGAAVAGVNRTEVECPVVPCPWAYTLTNPTTEERAGRLLLVVPSPVGAELVGAVPTELAPEEVAAGVAAARQSLDGALVVLGAGDAPSEVSRVGELVFQAAYAQDQAVLLAHLLGRHTRDELAAVLPADAMAQLDELGVS